MGTQQRRQPCASPTTTTPLPDGPHSFSVRATDQVFNVEKTPATRTFTVDTTRPDTHLTKKPPKRFKQARVKFLGSYPVAGHEEVRARRQAAGKAWREAAHWIDELRAQVREP